MPINFEDLLNLGKESADLVIRNNSEIDETIESFRASLSTFLNLNINFTEEIEYEDDTNSFAARIRITNNLFEPRKKTGYSYICIQHTETGVTRRLIKIQRSNDGYPITVIIDKSHYINDNQEEFARALGAIASNSQTHLTLRSFQRMVEEKNTQTKTN